jgi:PAS domain S-box-containing protein
MVQDLGRTAVAVGPEPGAVVASAPDAVIATTPLGEITSCDPVAARLYGYAAEELVGQSGDVLIPPERRALEREILAQVMAGADVPPFHTDRVCRDGTVVTVSLTISPLIDTAGTIVGALTVSHRVSGQQGGADRREALTDAADQLRRLARQSWGTSLAQFVLGVGGAASSAISGNIAGTALSVADTVLGIRRQTDPGTAFTYLYRVNKHFARP